MEEAVRFSLPGDADALAPILRDEDKDEALAAGASSPLEALRLSQAYSRPSLTVVDALDRPVMMLGVVPLSEEVGGIWLLSSDIISKKPVTFLRQSKKWLEFFHSLYPVLTNAVDARNTVHIEWLKWLGFVFINEVRPRDLPFYTFVRVQHVYRDGSSGPRD